MAVKLNNIEDVLETMAKMADDSGTVVIREARKNLRAVVRKYMPIFKSETPRRSGDLAKSIKVKSRSRQGRSTVRLVWMADYAGYVNFKKSNSESPFFASDKFNELKKPMDSEGLEAVKDAFRVMFKANGIKVIEE
jgi:hypothetical protein